MGSRVNRCKKRNAERRFSRWKVLDSPDLRDQRGPDSVDNTGTDSSFGPGRDRRFPDRRRAGRLSDSASNAALAVRGTGSGYGATGARHGNNYPSLGLWILRVRAWIFSSPLNL